MPEPGWGDSSSCADSGGYSLLPVSAKLRQDSWRLIWPTLTFINDVCCSSEMGTDNGEDGGQMEEPEHLLFLSPQVLALMEPDILSQLRTYIAGPGSTMCGLQTCPPHNKSYARMLSDRCQEVKSAGVSDCGDISSDDETVVTQPRCSCPDLAWFLLTSACLSQGRKLVVIFSISF